MTERITLLPLFSVQQQKTLYWVTLESSMPLVDTFLMWAQKMSYMKTSICALALPIPTFTETLMLGELLGPKTSF